MFPRKELLFLQLLLTLFTFSWQGLLQLYAKKNAIQLMPTRHLQQSSEEYFEDDFQADLHQKGTVLHVSTSIEKIFYRMLK